MPFIDPTLDNLVTVTLERGGAVYPIPPGAEYRHLFVDRRAAAARYRA